MNISNSDEKFIPTIDWIRDKYNELNTWLFDGKLGDCDFELFTKGKGSMGRTLGLFKFQRTGLKARRSDRRMVYYINSEVFVVTEDSFAKVTKPMIALNGNYKRTELSWLSTLVHEMCHYYTYRRGFCPVQAHGPEFRSIAAVVNSNSNGIFNVQRFGDSEDSELDTEIEAKNKKREDNKKSKLTSILVFKKNGTIQLVTTASQALIDQIESQNTNTNCIKILKSTSPEFIDYLWSKGYKKNMKTYRFWPVGQNVVDEMLKYPHTKIDILGINEVFKLTANDIKLMVEMTIEKLMGQNNDEFIDINPNMNLSNETPLE